MPLLGEAVGKADERARRAKVAAHEASGADDLRFLQVSRPGSVRPCATPTTEGMDKPCGDEEMIARIGIDTHVEILDRKGQLRLEGAGHGRLPRPVRTNESDRETGSQRTH